MKESNNHITCWPVLVRELGKEDAWCAVFSAALLLIVLYLNGAVWTGLRLAIPALFAANTLIWLALSVRDSDDEPTNPPRT